MKIEEIIKSIIKQLSDVSDAPDIDAYRIVSHVLQHDTSWLVAHGNDLIAQEHLSSIERLVTRRRHKEPLAYILGEWDFYGRTFIVTPDVLVPRPETENLINTALPIIEDFSRKFGRTITVADVGTGSGCIAITLLLESSFIERIIATDISTTALSVAKQNAQKFDVSDVIDFREGNMLDPISQEKIDLVVSNPPYVPSSELEQTSSVDTDGLHFEPQYALDGGEDGLQFVNQILNNPIPAIIETIGGTIITHGI